MDRNRDAQGETVHRQHQRALRLSGISLSEAWDQIDEDSRSRLCADIGGITRSLHLLPVEDVCDLPPDWETFLRDQRTHCVERQREYQLEERWLDQIEGFLGSVELIERPPTLLHTELMREHFLVEGASGSWRISGLLDFEPAMVGHPEYDFASVGLFIGKGNPALVGSVLDGYKLDDRDRAGLPERAMVYALLHRYSCLPWYLRTLPHDGADTFEDLAQHWWGNRP